MKKNVRANILLLLTAIIWGSSFVAQVQGMEYVGPFTYIFSRNVVASIFLLVYVLIRDRDRRSKRKYVEENPRDLIVGGIVVGLVLFVAMAFQQVGIQYTTAGKAGFITSLYIVLVPVLGIFLGNKVSLRIWFCVVLAAFGLYLLSVTEGFSLGLGDTYVLICAFAYSLHILVIDYFSPKVDGVKLSLIQFIVAGILGGIIMLVRETFRLEDVLNAALPILYAGVLSSGLGYTFQIVAQKDTAPTVASLIMSLEAPFALIAGMIILTERVTTRELIGCIIMFAAIIIAQLPNRNKGERIPEYQK